MARFLVSTMPATGHVNPAIPVASELVARGHEVWWHTGPAYQGAVEATGARFVPFEATPDFDQVHVEPDPGTRGMAAGISVMRRLFVDRVAGQVADYRRILDAFPADVLVADMCVFGAATLNDLGGPPYASLGINPLVTLDPEIPPYASRRGPATTALGRARNRAFHWLARHLFLNRVTALLDLERARLGLPPLPRGTVFSDLQQSPYLHLMPTTLAFEYPRRNLAPQVRFVGPLLPPPPAPFEPPPWWGDLEGRRVVHVTQGTYATGAGDLVRPTLDALAREDVLVVATTPDTDALGPLPPNARAGRFVPHAHLLPRVDAMVTNAGYNGVLTALAHGVPMVCAGESEDKAEVSARVAWAGAGIDLATATPTPARLRAAVRDVLRDPSYGANAGRIQADFARHRPAAEAADLLEEVARTRAPLRAAA